MTKIIITVLMFFLASGCSSQVKQLRRVSDQSSSDLAYTVKRILDNAHLEAIQGKTEVSIRFVTSVSEVKLIAKAIRKIDFRFDTIIDSTENYVQLIVRW